MLQLTSTQKFAYYDRSVDSKYLIYEDDFIAPHLPTLRDTHTITTNKRAIIESIYCDLIRSAEATGNALVKSYIEIDPFDGPLFQLMVVQQSKTAYGTAKNVCYSPRVFLNAGDIVSLYTSDTYPSGSMRYSIMISISEFDL
jgi:hypothetical protein